MKKHINGLGNSLCLMVLVLLAVAISLPANASALANAPPVIGSIDMAPESPSKYNDVLCTVSVSDADGNLDYVEFTWFVNGVMQRQTNKLVYGSSGQASDTLSGTKQPNDYIVCEAKAYDFEKAYDRATHAVRVGTVTTNSVPQISYVDVTPRHPNPQQDLTCSVFATDADDNLDHVIFEWLVNERIIRTSAKQVTGSSDVATDELDVSRTVQGDWMRCRANVYDASGTMSTKDTVSVVMGASPYPTPDPYGNKPVAILKVYDNTVNADDDVEFDGYSSYDSDGSVVQYKFLYGDGQESGWLPEAYSYHSYDDDGTYYARLKVKDSQQIESDWSPSVAIRVGTGSGSGTNNPVIEDMSMFKYSGTDYVRFECRIETYDRNGDLDYVRFKWYFNDELMFTEKNTVNGSNDETSDEISLITGEDDVIRCEATVYDKRHNSASATRTTGGEVASTGGTGCSALFTKFDYVTYLMEGNSGWASAEVQNTGSAGTVTLKLYVDNVQKEQYSIHLASGVKLSKKFTFQLAKGAHMIAVESITPCGTKANRTVEMTVFPADSSGFVPTERQESGAGTVKETSVKITPATMDIEINKGDVATVYIESPAQVKFRIAVEGLPDNWANYPSEVDVNGAKTAFIYVVPKAVGKYNFIVKVTANGRIYEQNVALYVAAEGTKNSNADSLTGMIGVAEGNWIIGLAILVILAVLTAMYFVAGRAKGKKYEDRIYGQRKAPYYGPYNQARQQAKPPYDSNANVNAKKSPAGSTPSAQPAKPAQTAHSHMHWPHLGWPSRLFTGSYSDGTKYPKYGIDFMR